MAEQPLPTRILIAMRSRLWRSERSLCRELTGKNFDAEVVHQLICLGAAGSVQRWDNSGVRWQLTLGQGRNEAKRAVDALKKRKAA